MLIKEDLQEIIDKQTKKLIGLLIDKKFYSDFFKRNDIDEIRNRMSKIDDELNELKFTRSRMLKNNEIEKNEYDKIYKKIEDLDKEKQDIGQNINYYNEILRDSIKTEAMIPEVKKYINLIKNILNNDNEIKEIEDEVFKSK